MNKTISRVELEEALSNVKYCIDNKGTIPIFSYVCFRNNQVLTFNGVSGIVYDMEQDIEACIPGDVLIKLISSYNTDTIDISSADNYVKFGDTKITSVDESNFPFKVLDIPAEAQSIIVTDEFIHNLVDCITCVNKKSVSVNESGITVLMKGDILTLNAVDDLRVARASIYLAHKDDISIILPHDFCKLILTFYKNNQDCIIYIWDDNVAAVFGGIVVYTKVNTTVKRYDFDGAINTYYDDELEFNTINDSFVEVVNRVASIFPKETMVKISTDKKKMTIYGKSDKCELEEVVSFDNPFPIIDCSIPIGILQDVTRLVTDIMFVDKKSSVVLIGKKDEFILLTASI